MCAPGDAIGSTLGVGPALWVRGQGTCRAARGRWGPTRPPPTGQQVGSAWPAGGGRAGGRWPPLREGTLRKRTKQCRDRKGVEGRGGPVYCQTDRPEREEGLGRRETGHSACSNALEPRPRQAQLTTCQELKARIKGSRRGNLPTKELPRLTRDFTRNQPYPARLSFQTQPERLPARANRAQH